MGAVYVAINSNQRTRFDFLRFLGRTGLDSLRTQYKTLLNDTDGGNIYHYFWVADGCSRNTPSGECPTRTKPGELENPSTAYWLDGVWKQGAGRQKAPMCKHQSSTELASASPGNSTNILSTRNQTEPWRRTGSHRVCTQLHHKRNHYNRNKPPAAGELDWRQRRWDE